MRRRDRGRPRTPTSRRRRRATCARRSPQLAEPGARRGAHDDWIAQLRDDEQAKRAAEAPTLDADRTPIKPTRIYGELRQRLDRDAIVIGDGGDFVSYAGKLRRQRTSRGRSSIPVRTAASAWDRATRSRPALAHPDRQVVLHARRRRDRLRARRLRGARAARRRRRRDRRQQRHLGPREAPDAGAVRLRRRRRAAPGHPLRPGGRRRSAATASCVDDAGRDRPRARPRVRDARACRWSTC